MKRHIVLIGLAMTCWMAAALAANLAAPDGEALLADAFAQSPQVGYVAEFERPVLPGTRKLAKAIFYRCPQADGALWLRADFYDANGLCWSFWENGEGAFAQHVATGLTVRGEAFYPLNRLEWMNNRPYWEEFKHADFQVTEAKFGRYPAWRVIVRTRTTEEAGKSLDGLAVVGRPGELSQFPRHPFVREYLLERESRAILGVKNFSRNGKLLSRNSLGMVTLQPDWTAYPSLFDTPKAVNALVSDFTEFRGLVEEARKAQQQERRRHRNHRGVGAFLAAHAWQVMALLGCGFLVLAAGLRRRR